MFNKEKRFLVICLAVMMSIVFSGLGTGWACVGRKIVIGYRDYAEQRIISEMMGILIEERTGTKVVFKVFEDTMELHRALESNEIQMYVEYTGVGLTEVLGIQPINDPAQVYKKVKSEYNRNFNLIWLKSFGFTSVNEENKDLIAAGVPLFAAPLVRKDTLKKFPALSRLLNKLKGKISNKLMAKMVSDVEDKGKKPKRVAGRLLNKLGVSFSFTPGVG